MYLLKLNDQIEDAKRRIQEAQKVVDTKRAELKKLENRAWFCKNCNKYYPKDSTTADTETETRVETVYTDAGYGDDDEIAEVTRQYSCVVCPVCGRSQRTSDKGVYLSERNRHRRRE